MFFPVAPSEDGERAERLTITLFGAKDEDDRNMRIGADEFASHETMLYLSYGFRGELTVY